MNFLFLKTTLNQNIQSSVWVHQIKNMILHQKRATAIKDVRLRCIFPVADLVVIFNISSSKVSLILITWFDFLYIHMRTLPVRASKSTATNTMPDSFKKMYPNTRVIIDCTELFTGISSS